MPRLTKTGVIAKIFALLFCVMLLVPAIWPQLDLWISGLFYRPGEGFFLADTPVFVALHWLAYYGARGLGVLFAVMAIVTLVRRQVVLSLDAKAWLFLLLALIIAPGLVANAGLKDHWGRARPREVTQFGSHETFTPFYEPHFEKAHSNGSFVSGDGAFGFFLPVFGYVGPRKTSRCVFWGSMAAGGLFSLARIAMGAHFFSDVVYAAFFMLTSVALVHAAVYGWKETCQHWRSWLGLCQDGKRS